MKKFYEENRVFSILMLIVIACLILIACLGVGYVLRSRNTSVYGNRLDGIGDVKISEKMINNLKSQVKEMAKVSAVDINVHGKIVNFDVTFNNEATVEEAKNVAISIIALFEEDYLNYYDIQFLMVNDLYNTNKDKKENPEDTNPFPILGYKKAERENISWSHNAN